jgi:hypothetical protein
VAIRGIGLLAPGLSSWPIAAAVLRGEPRTRPPPRCCRRRPACRRPSAGRAGPSIRLAMAVADEAIGHAAIDPQHLATVFASSGGEGSNCHVLCETLAGADRQISPTRFTNSVHNAPAGYWHIAVGSRSASTSLSAYDGSFAAGLLEAATQVLATGSEVLLVALDVPYPEPLHRLRPLPGPAGVALVLAPPDAAGALARVAIGLVDATRAGPLSACSDSGLDALRSQVPAGRRAAAARSDRAPIDRAGGRPRLPADARAACRRPPVGLTDGDIAARPRRHRRTDPARRFDVPARRPRRLGPRPHRLPREQPPRPHASAAHRKRPAGTVRDRVRGAGDGPARRADGRGRRQPATPGYLASARGVRLAPAAPRRPRR